LQHPFREKTREGLERFETGSNNILETRFIVSKQFQRFANDIVLVLFKIRKGG
jgi:hypothetical protein